MTTKLIQVARMIKSWILMMKL